jgi:peptidyl-dipeptidase Dcp
MLSSAQSDEGLQAIEGKVSAKLTAYGTEISHDPQLFGRVRAVWEQRAHLTPEQVRLVERSYKGFVASGAALGGRQKQRLAEIAARLSDLSVKFGQNVLAATNTCEVILSRHQLTGIPSDLVDRAARRAAERGLDDRYLFVLDRGVFEALLTFADERPVREEVWRAFTMRCQGGTHDNLPVIADMVALRQEQAALLGYATYADYALDDSMATGLLPLNKPLKSKLRYRRLPTMQ